MAKKQAEPLYKQVFLPGTPLRKRFDVIYYQGIDPSPGMTGSEHFERHVEALVNGRPNPSLKMPFNKNPKDSQRPLISRVHQLFDELFELRGQG